MAAIIYSRYSTDQQSESSIVDQLRLCREFAAARAWPIRSEHKDEGISGAALGNRPGAQAALAAIQRGDVLLVTDLSRLSRSQDLAPLLARIRHRGGRVMGVQDGYDSDSRTARMQAGLSGIMSEEFRSMVADRTHSALESRARVGQPTGGKAYENSEIVVEIFTRFAAGESMKAIASDLNRREIPSPGAKWKPRSRPRGRWLVSTLHAMLRNERYIGRLVWNRSQWVKDPDTGIRHRHERPESEWIIQECERFIDPTTWQRVQSRFRVGQGRGGVARYLLSGLLECAVCGGKMICYGGSQHRYICGTYHAGGEHACRNASTFARSVAEEMILAPVMDDLLSPQAIAEGLRVMRQERASPPKPEPRDREIAELERLVRDGVLSPETAAPAIAKAQQNAQERRRSEPIPQQPWPSEKAWRETVALMREILTGDDVLAAREVLRELVGPGRCRQAEDGHVVVELTTRHILLATGTGGRVEYGEGESMGCGPTGPVDGFNARPRYQPIYRLVSIPVSTRKRRGGP